MNRMRWLAAGELLVGVSAIAGGLALLTGASDPGEQLLAGSVFDTYRWPGFVLAFVVGRSWIAASVAIWRRSRFTALLTTFAGVVMACWVVTEAVVIGPDWLQAPYLVVGIAVAIIGWRMHRPAPAVSQQ